MSETALDELAPRIAGFALSRARPVDDIVVGAKMWPQFLATLQSQALTGLALAAHESGSLVIGPAESQELVDRHRAVMVHTLMVERVLLELGPAFEGAGIEAIVLKGPALAHTAYPDPSWRPFTDLDLLVRTVDWRRACALLGQMGFRRNLPEPRKGFDERFGKAATHTNADGIQLDLHRTLVLGPFGLWMDPEDLISSVVLFSLGGGVFRRLDDTCRLLHACMHASLGWRPPLLMPMRDVAQLTDIGGVDWDRFGELSGKWRLTAVVKHAFETASRVFRTSPPDEVKALIAVQPPSKERRALEAYTTARRGKGGTSVSTLSAINGARNKVAYLVALLFPDRSFRAVRLGRQKSSYLRRLIVPVHWLARRSR